MLLTALQSAFEPDPSSSRYVVRETPGSARTGSSGRPPGGRSMRIWTVLDNRLMLEDLYAKLLLWAC